jgi:putative CocE/NonD family hydrolase
VLGPWFHGGWARSDGSKFGDIEFGQPTSQYFRDEVEFPFFDHYLNDGPDPMLPKALVFETGSNKWRKFDQWPPAGTSQESVYLGSNGALGLAKPAEGADEYVSDPARPVPFTQEVRSNRNREYMIADQRFAYRRPDVLSYETVVMDRDVTVAGPIEADLFASTSGTDADFIVKVIDVYPDATPAEGELQMGGYQMLLRWEVLRGKFRDSFEDPKPFRPNQPTSVKIQLNGVQHTFKKGHRMMVQIQSSMFPLIDRNPQRFEDINTAKDADFQKATIKIYHSPKFLSLLKIPILP